MGDLKVEGKVSEWCSKCKHCIAYDTIVTNGICKITTYSCEDPYDGMTRALDAEDDICCSMFEPTHDMSYDKMSRLEHELEMDKLRREIHQLKKEKVAHMKGIERLKGSNNDLKEAYNHLLKTFKKENESGSKIVEENVKLENEKTEGRYPWGSDEDKVIKYCANDVTIIAEQMAREKQKELEDKVEKYEKILIDILNETYEHPQLFEHNIHAYKLIPGHIKFLRNSFDTMCDKYDPVFEENTKLKEEIEALKSELTKMRFCQMNDDKRWDDLNHKFWLPLYDKIYGTRKVNKTYGDILSDISDLKEKNENLTEAIERRDKWVDELKEEKKAKDDELEYWKERCHNAETDVTTLNSKVEVLDRRNTNQSIIIGEKGKEIENLTKKNQELQWRNDNQSKMIQDIKQERDELKNELDKYKESDDIYFTTTQVNAMVKSIRKENGEIKVLKDQIGYLERENEMIKEMNSNQFKSIEKLKSEKAKLEKELEVALNKTTALFGSIHSRNEDIERLNTELVTKKKEYKDTINALKSQKKYLEERMAIMKDDIKYLKERYDAEDD